MKLEDVAVISHDGHRAAERPQWLVEGDRRTEVIRVLDRWYEGSLTPGPPTISYFKVELADGRVALLRYVPLFDRWARVLSRTDAPPPPPRRAKAKILPFRRPA